MSFTADKQTLDDLNLTGRYKSDSILNLFNQVRTGGGGKLLEQMFHTPFSEPEKITERSTIFRYFQVNAFEFPFQPAEISMMENYLARSQAGNLLWTGVTTLKKQVLATLVHDQQYSMLLKGFSAAVNVLNSSAVFFTKLSKTANAETYQDLAMAMAILSDWRLSALRQVNCKNLSVFTLIRYDHLLRHTLRKPLEELVQLIYRLDVYVAVAGTATRYDLCYPEPLPREDNFLQMTQVRHPALKEAVANSLTFQQDSNIVFLTGANMAGKSTLMKTVGVSVYLAHMGFPVAAEEMKFSVKDGIYTSINVADNLNMGYSHFYAEVLRVKKVAEEVSQGKSMLVIFDELFKGTNVKDAYDATLAVTAAFSLYRNCFFIISTHIIEVGEALKQDHDNIVFSYMPTVMNGSVPAYPYRLAKGITTDRQGMIIIENEGVLDLLNDDTNNRSRQSLTNTPIHKANKYDT